MRRLVTHTTSTTIVRPMALVMPMASIRAPVVCAVARPSTASTTQQRWLADDTKADATKKKSEPAKRQDKGIIAPPPLPSVALQPKIGKIPRGVGSLTAQPRDEPIAGKRRAAKLRDNNRVPGLIFNRDRPTDKLLISFDQDYIEAAVNSEIHFGSRVFNLTVEGHPTYTVVPHQIKFHPTNRRVLNITFMVKSTDKPHPINIPIILVGQDQHPGATAGQDIIQQHQYLLPCYWSHKGSDIIPEAIYIDTSKYLRGAVIRASDLVRPEAFPQVPTEISLSPVHKNHIIFSVRKYVRDKG